MSLSVRSFLRVCSSIPLPFGCRILTSRIVQVSSDGRDLVILSGERRVVFIQDFERICRGETTFEWAGLVLGIRPEEICSYLIFQHGRVCVATVRIFICSPRDCAC